MTMRQEDSHKKGTFSHIWYDMDTDTLLMYFNEGSIQDLTTQPQKCVHEFAEFCLHLDADTYNKMRQYFIDNPEPKIL